MRISSRDRDVLRPLADAVAAVAAGSGQERTRREWKRLNAVKPGRPMVHICQVPWHELTGRPGMETRCQGQLACSIEQQLRQKLYQAEHFPADTVCEARVWTMAVVSDSGWGLTAPARNRAGAIEYPSQIRSLADVARIGTPEVLWDVAGTAEKAAAIGEACGGAIRVEPHVWAAPAMWDLLIQWYGTNELMLDMVDRPELVHAAARRLADAIIARARSLEGQGALSLNNGGHGAGSGGLAYTDELPQKDFAGKVRLRDLWGNQMAQIFVGVSPAMHDEFALRYETEILSHFGLNCYGCCEPLHRKVGIARKIPRLKRISRSPWVDWEEGAAAVGRDLIFSAKPNPAFLAAQKWDPRPAREQLREILRCTREHGCPVEIVLKDIHTLRREPKRLAAWARMAMETVAEDGPRRRPA